MVQKWGIKAELEKVQEEIELDKVDEDNLRKQLQQKM